MNPNRYFQHEARGHLFEFEQLNSGTIRASAVDGRYNDRANRVLHRHASAEAITQAFDAARAHYYHLATGRAA